MASWPSLSPNVVLPQPDADSDDSEFKISVINTPSLSIAALAGAVDPSNIEKIDVAPSSHTHVRRSVAGTFEVAVDQAAPIRDKFKRLLLLRSLPLSSRWLLVRRWPL